MAYATPLRRRNYPLERYTVYDAALTGHTRRLASIEDPHEMKRINDRQLHPSFMTREQISQSQKPEDSLAMIMRWRLA